MRSQRSVWFGTAGMLWICMSSAWCQTMTPYERSMKQQELYDLQQQNARQQMQQQQQQQDQQWNESVRQSQGRQNAAAAQGREVLQTWQKRPPLAPERNPLLGRWNSQGNGGGAKGTPANGDMAALAAALVGGLTSGLCDSMLGRGLIEFRRDALVAIGAGGREQVKYHVEYRGGDSRVVVLPKDATSFTHMIIDFSGPDRATVNTVGCSLARVVGGATGAGGGSAVNASLAPTKWEMVASSEANGGMDLYVDRSTIRRSGHLAQISDLWDFRSAQAIEGKQFLSVRNEYQYDCANKRRRMLATRGFSQHMGRGNVVGSGDSVLAWEAIPATSVFVESWKAACDKP